MHVCMNVCMNVCMYVCMYSLHGTGIHAILSRYIYTHKHAHPKTGAYHIIINCDDSCVVCVCVRVHVYSCIPHSISPYIHAYIQKPELTMHAYIQKPELTISSSTVMILAFFKLLFHDRSAHTSLVDGPRSSHRTTCTP